MRSLKARSKDVLARIETAQRVDSTQQCTSEVEDWLQSVDATEEKVNSIKADYEQIKCRCVSGCSFKVCSNWKIGRKATKELVTVNDLYNKGEKFISGAISISRAGPPPPGQEMPSTSNLLSVDSNLQKVLGYLRDGDRTVGIFGMGGVGKTTLLKYINNKLCSGGEGNGGMYFEHVIWVVVSSNGQVHKVQKDIVKFLKLPLEENADSAMLHNAIFNFLKGKRFLLLLDDIWETLDLNQVGIPDNRVVVFTTRREEVCGLMRADRKVKVECLQEEDAWRLFKDNVGDAIIESPEIERIAKLITKRCYGLPLALKVIGGAMSSKLTSEEWQHTLASLKKAQPSSSKSIEKDLFAILKYSYDNLPDETAKKCLLFLALYPEDWSIFSTEFIDRLCYCDVMNTEDCNDINEVYDRGHHYIGVLKAACLLEGYDICGLSYFKLHDLIRDMALWITCNCGENTVKWVVRAGLHSEKPLKGVNNWEDAETLSLMDNNITSLSIIPTRRCEKLSTLLLQHNNIKALGLNLEINTILDLQNVVEDASIAWLELSGLRDSQAQELLPILLTTRNTLQYLNLENFPNMQELVFTTQQDSNSSKLKRRSFHRLLILQFQNLNQLSKIAWNRIMLVEMFPRLKFVKVGWCHRLRNLTWLGHLPCLRQLFIGDCDELEEIISDHGNSESTSHSSSSMLLFPNLEILILINLKKLRSISKSTIDGNRLKHLSATNCPELNRIPFSFQSETTSKTEISINSGELEWWNPLDQWANNISISWLKSFVKNC